MSAFLATLGRDRPLYGFICAYAAACGILSWVVGTPEKFLPFMYMVRWACLLALLWVLYLAATAVSLAPSPTRAIRARVIFAEKLPKLAAATMLCFALGILQGTYTSVKTIAPDLSEFRHDVFLADLDRALHGTDPWTLLRFLDPYTDAIQPLYSLSWLLLVVCVTIFAVAFSRSEQLKAQYAWTFVLCWTLLGNLMSSATLSAGPAYYENVTGSPRFRELTDYLAQHDGPFSAHSIQAHLWSTYSGNGIDFGSGISAFPSMHMSIATLFALYGFRISRLVGLAFTVYGLLILAGSVHLGWHYAVDGYASIIATIIIWKAVAIALQGAPRGWTSNWKVPDAGRI